MKLYFIIYYLIWFYFFRYFVAKVKLIFSAILLWYRMYSLFLPSLNCIITSLLSVNRSCDRLFKDNFFGNFINIIKRMIHTPEEKIFMYKKCLVLGSTALVQRVNKNLKQIQIVLLIQVFQVNLFKKTGSIVKLNRKTRINAQTGSMFYQYHFYH